MIDYNTIPPYIKKAIDIWVESGRPPGSFLQAVLENDLSDALARADAHSLAALHSIVGYLYNECPGLCWGTPEKVEAWRRRALAQMGLVGKRSEYPPSTVATDGTR